MRPIRRSTRPITGNRRSLSEDGRPSALSVADLAADRTARRNVLGCREHQTHRGFRCYLPLLARCVLPPAELSPVHTSDNVAINGDIVAKNRDIVAETGDIVAKNTMLPVSATMSPFLATLSLVWTGLYVAPWCYRRRQTTTDAQRAKQY